MYYVYLVASRKHGTLYLGVTNDLVRRVYEHKTKAAAGFTAKYGVDRLVWFERTKIRCLLSLVRKTSRNGDATGNFVWSKKKIIRIGRTCTK